VKVISESEDPVGPLEEVTPALPAGEPHFSEGDLLSCHQQLESVSQNTSFPHDAIEGLL